jgi:hypothetical protein
VRIAVLAKFSHDPMPSRVLCRCGHHVSKHSNGTGCCREKVPCPSGVAGRKPCTCNGYRPPRPPGEPKKKYRFAADCPRCGAVEIVVRSAHTPVSTIARQCPGDECAVADFQRGFVPYTLVFHAVVPEPVQVVDGVRILRG